MKSLFCLIAILISSFCAFSQGKVYQANAPGMWSSQGVWADEMPNHEIGAGDTVMLNRNIILDQPLSVHGVIMVNQGVTIYSSSKIEVQEGGQLINRGSLMVNDIINHGLVHNHHSLKALQSMTGPGAYLDANGQPLIGMAE